MDTVMNTWIGGWVSALLLGLTFSAGWGIGYKTVARECRSIGTFYVGDKIYECKVKEKSQ